MDGADISIKKEFVCNSLVLMIGMEIISRLHG